MALDTTVGGASADSYASVADWQAYATSMGWTLSGDTDTFEANLRRATAYLDRIYRWVGRRADDDQALAWPRIVWDTDEDGYAIPSDEIPAGIVNATYELAYLENQGNDLLSYTDGAAIKRRKVKAGPVESETEYLAGSSVESRVVAIEGLIRPYLSGGQVGADTQNIPLVRG